MKKRFISALIGVGMVALIFPLFSGSEAARTPASYPIVGRGAESLKTDFPAPTPTPPGGTIYIPLPGRPIPPDKLDIVRVNVARGSAEIGRSLCRLKRRFR